MVASRKWVSTALVAIFVIWGFVLRVHELGWLSVWLDEAISVLAAKQVVVHGIPLLPSGWLYTGGLPQSYLLAVWCSIFNWGEFWIRFPSVLVGTLLIFVVYRIARKVWNERVGVALAAFQAFSYWQIAWSRQARMYVFLELFFFLGLYYGYRFVNEQRTREGVLAAVFSLLAAATHGFGIMVFPLLAGMWFLKHRSLKLPGGAWWQMAYGVFGAVAAWFSVRGFLSLRHAYFYLPGYIDFMLGEYFPIMMLVGLAIFIGWKERYLLVFLLVYIGLIGNYIFLYHLRYTFWVMPIAAVLVFVVLDKYLKNKWMYIGAAVLVVLGSSAMFIPQKEVYLEPGTPQPPWREVYKSIPSDAEFSDVTPVIAAYYGRTPSSWLKNSLSGVRETKINDSYIGVEALGPKGLLVISERSYSQVYTPYLENATYEEFGDVFWRRARVYADFNVSQ